MINTAVLANMKKAQGLTLNTIIIAVLALIVLIVLIIIFTGKINLFNTQANKCVGPCKDSPYCDGGIIGYKSDDCKNSGGYCCPPPPSNP